MDVDNSNNNISIDGDSGIHSYGKKIMKDFFVKLLRDPDVAPALNQELLF
jgi:hypothetical protein